MGHHILQGNKQKFIGMPAYFKYIHKNCHIYKEKMDNCTLDHTNEEYMQVTPNTPRVWDITSSPGIVLKSVYKLEVREFEVTDVFGRFNSE